MCIMNVSASIIMINLVASYILVRCTELFFLGYQELSTEVSMLSIFVLIGIGIVKSIPIKGDTPKIPVSEISEVALTSTETFFDGGNFTLSQQGGRSYK